MAHFLIAGLAPIDSPILAHIPVGAGAPSVCFPGSQGVALAIEGQLRRVSSRVRASRVAKTIRQVT